jgi:hypothetical protein
MAPVAEVAAPGFSEEESEGTVGIERCGTCTEWLHIVSVTDTRNLHGFPVKVPVLRSRTEIITEEPGSDIVDRRHPGVDREVLKAKLRIPSSMKRMDIC